jgi:hypothetical protein
MCDNCEIINIELSQHDRDVLLELYVREHLDTCIQSTFDNCTNDFNETPTIEQRTIQAIINQQLVKITMQHVEKTMRNVQD